MIINVVFDLGGVLVDWNPRHLYRKLLPNEAAVDDFLQRICNQEWNVQQDAGRSIEEAVVERTALYPEQKERICAYYERWEEMLGGPIQGSVEILSELRNLKLPLYALSNWSEETYPIAKERYDFLDWFDGEVISGRIGIVKPKPGIYHYLLEFFGLHPEETLFIDDREDNVASARKLGIHGILFHHPRQLREALVPFHLL